MKRFALAVVALAVASTVGFFVLTIPVGLDNSELAAMETGDAKRGERIFWAGGCDSCHAAKGAKGKDRFLLGGGQALSTPFGTFLAPNVSSDAVTGIGSWTSADFANAMKKGISPQGSHYYPAFPYTSYTRMNIGDVADLWAFLQTLPAVSQQNLPHDLPLPFRLRRGLGLWKLLYLSDAPVIDTGSDEPKVKLGQYLVEGPGHCGECHTPRNLIGGPQTSRWLSGGAAPEGKGKIPNITPDVSGIGSWSENDIAYCLESGFTPEFDSLGGSMVPVQQNMAELGEADRQAIAAYLKVIPAVSSK